MFILFFEVMKTNTILKIIIAISIIILILAIVLPIFAFRDLHKANRQNEELANYIKQLEVNIDTKDIEIKDLQNKVTGLNQELENISIKYISNQLYIDELEARYLSALSYSNIAESILLANGIEFYKAVGGDD